MHLRPQVILGKARYVLRRHLDARDLPHTAVHADPQLNEAQVMQVLLRLVHAQELLSRDGITVGKARGEARRRGHVPRGEAQLAREGAHVGLGEAGLLERAPHFELRQRTQTGTVVSLVIDVGAVDHKAHPLRGRQSLDLGEDCLLAVVAAVLGILGKAGNGQLVKGKLKVTDAVLLTELVRATTVAVGDGAPHGGDGNHVLPQHVVGDQGEQRGVHPARKRHGYGAHRAKGFLQRRALCLQVLIGHRNSHPSAGELSHCMIDANATQQGAHTLGAYNTT